MGYSVYRSRSRGPRNPPPIGRSATIERFVRSASKGSEEKQGIMPLLEVHRVGKSFVGAQGRIPALGSASFAAEEGDWVTCIGPSGCGKTTLLRIVSGLLEPDEGTVHVEGLTGRRLGAIAFLPQHDTLLPWRTAIDNATLASEIDRRPRSEAAAEAGELFDRFGLRGSEALYPHQLSGGMRQRLALARTFLSHRPLLLLDEPLGALDPLTRASLQDWLLTVWSEFRKTIVLVTHDVEEALYLSDRLLVLTPRPATVKEELSLDDLLRPRSRTDFALVSRRAEVLDLLSEGTP